MKYRDKEEKFIELRVQGKSFEAISKEINISKPTLIKWSKKYNCEISNLCQIHIESQKEKLELTAHRRLKFFSIILRKLEDQIESRDFSKLSDEKLLTLLLKISEVSLESSCRGLAFQEKIQLFEPFNENTSDWTC